MKNKLLIKVGAIAILTILLLIPLTMVGSKVSERQRYSDSVERDISNMWTASQRFVGPVLVVPYTEYTKKTVWDKKIERDVIKTITHKRELFFFPERLDIDANIETEERARGIYTVPVYTSEIKLSGEYVIPANYGINSARNIRWSRPYVSYGLSDMRGIRSEPMINWGNEKFPFLPGSKIKRIQHGAHAQIMALQSAQKKSYSFTMDMKVAGTKTFDIVPIGKNTSVSMTSPWQHPSFLGRFLPVTRNISELGFTAQWKVNHFATNIQKKFYDCQEEGCHAFNKTSFGVSFIKPISVYNLTDRSIKYGILFIVLTFAVFFLFEMLKKLAIHPIQYALVGLSLVTFYQLLLALSEHIDFDIAYIISSIAATALITIYLSYVLKSAFRSMIFGGSLFSLYMMLLMILKSEDSALLMGSILVFSSLAAFMLLTRNIDWYEIGGKTKQITTPSA